MVYNNPSFHEEVSMDLLQNTYRSEESDLSRLQKLYKKYGNSKFRMSKSED